MRNERIVCDVCGHDYGVIAFRIPDGSEPDPSGHGQSENAIMADLCNRCAGRMMCAARVRKALRKRGVA